MEYELFIPDDQERDKLDKIMIDMVTHLKGLPIAEQAYCISAIYHSFQKALIKQGINFRTDKVERWTG